jgi:phage terminase large subunit-like protein
VSASLAERLADLAEPERLQLLSALPPDEVERCLSEWQFWARPEQLSPDGQWTVWAIITGRGWGKTRTGAEWILDRCEAFAALGVKHYVALVGRTAADVRDVMINGESGLRECAERRGYRLVHVESRREVTIAELGTTMTTYSAEEPDQLRGPSKHSAWCDEPAAWTHKVDAEGNTAWSNLMFTLRLDPPSSSGMVPQVVVTTTPKPIELVIEWFRRAGVIPDDDGELREPDPSLTLTRGSLYDNIGNLSPAFVELVTGQYGGTLLGAQEIGGELLTAVEGALWQPEYIGPHRVNAAPDLRRCVVAVDPPGSWKRSSAECGIVAAGIGRAARMPSAELVAEAKRMGLVAELHAQTQHAYVLADASVRGKTETWAAAAVALYRGLGADAIVGEVNYGGDMVRAAVHAIDPTIPFSPVTASRGKRIRAEPVSLLYAKGRVHHVGTFGLLESQMLTWTDAPGQPSPDRLDAAVWAISELLPHINQQPARSKTAARERVPTGAAAARRSAAGSASAVRLPGARRR